MAIADDEMNRRLIKLAESPVIRIWRTDYANLSSAERVFVAIWELEADVNNDGFHGYFFNYGARLAPHVVDALRAISAVSAAAIVEQALEVAGNLAWSDMDLRRAQMDDLSQDAADRLTALTQEFFAYPDNLTALLYNYVCQNRAEIGAPEDF